MPKRSAARRAGWVLGLAALAIAPFAAPSLGGQAAPARDASPELGSAAAEFAAPPAASPGRAGAAGPRARDAAGPLVVGHRGASGHAPENTLAAAEAAADLGIAWVETDVQRTADGALILMHDTTLERTTDVEERYPGRAPWNVSDFTAAEIATLDAGSWFGAEFAGERVPTLGDWLAGLRSRGQSLLLELKSPELYPGIEAEVLAELERLGWLGGEPGERLVIQSFDAEAVRTVHALAPGVETGFIGAPDPADVAEYAEFADEINPRYRDLTAAYVAGIQAHTGPQGRPLKVYAWTIDDGPAAVAAAGLGVDGIISDVPDVVRDALAG
ncbi:glycerophosphodiester phosphodiesterase [Streptomyces hoynatensis]|uniref:Glycerophosphodiester phosphodiesterase n=1 Tax=Streptomyces hoynatensis TaxID=1141874 RepID=A0A3A9Z2B2_9ACTN|nr:glycerophosphodiester phosphodiesterase family protein [Streptomyces hoynatensis]RKN42388.1 glycerophosphodiester phosphodiesterase [Streptomyces hoynatensis]